MTTLTRIALLARSCLGLRVGWTPKGRCDFPAPPSQIVQGGEGTGELRIADRALVALRLTRTAPLCRIGR